MTNRGQGTYIVNKMDNAILNEDIRLYNLLAVNAQDSIRILADRQIRSRRGLQRCSWYEIG